MRTVREFTYPYTLVRPTPLSSERVRVRFREAGRVIGSGTANSTSPSLTRPLRSGIQQQQKKFSFGLPTIVCEPSWSLPRPTPAPSVAIDMSVFDRPRRGEGDDQLKVGDENASLERRPRSRNGHGHSRSRSVRIDVGEEIKAGGEKSAVEVGTGIGMYPDILGSGWTVGQV